MIFLNMNGINYSISDTGNPSVYGNNIVDVKEDFPDGSSVTNSYGLVDPSVTPSHADILGNSYVKSNYETIEELEASIKSMGATDGHV